MVVVKKLFSRGKVEVCLLDDIKDRFEAISFNVPAEDLHVLYDFRQISKAFLFLVSVPNGGIVIIAKDEALAFVRGKVGHARFLYFA